jgi:Esterase/lipase
MAELTEVATAAKVAARHRAWVRAGQVGLGVLGSLAATAATTVTALQTSNRVAVHTIRTVSRWFGGDGPDVSAFVPDDVIAALDVVYDPEDPDGRLDIFRPTEVRDRLPTIVCVHGGGFVNGTKEMLDDYLAVLASHGFTTVSVEYTKAPEARYPYPVEQLDRALAFLCRPDVARIHHIDPTQFVLAGDSAGAHIAAQAAIAISDPTYAAGAGLPATITRNQLRALVLASGAVDLTMTQGLLGGVGEGWYFRTVLAAYIGRRDFSDDPCCQWASLPENVTSALPPTFVTTGPWDNLKAHSYSMVTALEGAGAEVETLFFPQEATDRSIGHEYQLDLNTPEAKTSMRRVVTFLRAHTTAPLRLGVADRWDASALATEDPVVVPAT